MEKLSESILPMMKTARKLTLFGIEKEIKRVSAFGEFAPEIFLMDYSKPVFWKVLDDQFNEEIDMVGLKQGELFFHVCDTMDGYELKVDDVPTEKLLEILQLIEQIAPMER